MSSEDWKLEAYSISGSLFVKRYQMTSMDIVDEVTKLVEKLEIDVNKKVAYIKIERDK